jgi:hypothetical protein
MASLNAKYIKDGKLFSKDGQSITDSLKLIILLIRRDNLRLK